MTLIYIALFMTVILSFWMLQIYNSSHSIDRGLMRSFSTQVMLEHEQATETVRDPFLYGDTNLDEILSSEHLEDIVLYPDAGNAFMRMCYNDSGAPVDCYDGLYARSHNTTSYNIKTKVTADVDIGWVQSVTFVEISGVPLDQRDLYRAFVDQLGNNLQMGLISNTGSYADGNGDYIVKTGLSGVTDRRVSAALIDDDDKCFDEHKECFVMITDLAPIATDFDREIGVSITLDAGQTFNHDGGFGDVNHEGVLVDETPEILNFTLTDGINSNPNVDLYIVISGYDEEGTMVPSIGGDVSRNGFNQNFLDLDDLVLKNSNGDEVDNHSNNYTSSMSIEITPNFEQIGGSYVTITAVYEGQDLDNADSVFKDNMTFLVLIDEKAGDFICDANNDGNILNDWEQDGSGNYLIGNPDADNPEIYAAKQLLCLTQNQDDVGVLSSNYLMINDADFGPSDDDADWGIDFTVTKTYDSEGYLSDLSANVTTNKIDWDDDGTVGNVRSGAGDFKGTVEEEGWIPLGLDEDNPFIGIFDGGDGNHKIKNIYTSRDHEYHRNVWITSYRGVFNFTNGATIRNLDIDNAYLDHYNKNKDGKVYMYTGLVAKASGNTLISNCNFENFYLHLDGDGQEHGARGWIGGLIGHSEGDVEITDVSVNGAMLAGLIAEHQTRVTMRAGMLVGLVDGDIDVTNASVNADILADHEGQRTTDPLAGAVGGLIGRVEGGADISHSMFSGSLKGNRGNLGGFVGYNNSGIISNSYTIGDIYTVGDIINVDNLADNVGGLIGKVENAVSISNSYTTGDITGDGQVGGLVGYSSHNNPSNVSILNSFSTSRVTSLGNYVGGILGLSSNDINFENVFSTGNISGNDRVGGILGAASTTSGFVYTANIDNCYSIGNISGNGDVGGINGQAYMSTVQNSYSRGDVSGNYNVGGIIGYNYQILEMNDIYSSGNISGNMNVGGLTGGHTKRGITINDSYARGTVSGNTYVGKLVGYRKEDGYTVNNVNGLCEFGAGVNGVCSDGNILTINGSWSSSHWINKGVNVLPSLVGFPNVTKNANGSLNMNGTSLSWDTNIWDEDSLDTLTPTLKNMPVSE